MNDRIWVVSRNGFIQVIVSTEIEALRWKAALEGLERGHFEVQSWLLGKRYGTE